MRNIIFFLLAAGALEAPAQLYVGPSTSFHIATGTPFSFDRLALTPSAPFGFSDNTLSVSTAPVPSAGGMASIGRVYTTRAPVTYSGTIRFSYLPGDLNGQHEPLLVLMRQYSGEWSSPAPGLPDAASRTVTAAYHQIPFDALTLAEAGSVLPLAVSSFQAGWLGPSIAVRWAVDDNEHYSYFVVERSSNGGPWELAGQVSALLLSGRASYAWTDASIHFDKRQYRLRLAGRSGQVWYSGVVSLQQRPSSRVIASSQGGELLLRFTGPFPQDVQVYQPSGQPVWTAAGPQASYRVPSLPAGLYLVVYRSGDAVQTLKVLHRPD